MVQTTQKFELFNKKNVFLNHFWQSVDTILEDVSVTKQFFNADLLISRLPFFSVSKSYGCPTHVTRLKVVQNMADPISIKDSDSRLKHPLQGHLM